MFWKRPETPAASCQITPARSYSNHRLRVAPRAQQPQQPQQPQQQQGEQQWLPPAAWVSAVLSGLQQSVDAVTIEPYTQLLQECVVLQPQLLNMPPAQAAATCWCLERGTLSSAVWYGPAVVADLLQQHTPHSLSAHISSLLQHWLYLGQNPHSFGQLWLQAPAALLRFKNVTQFESHLEQLAQLVPELPPGQLLGSSSTLAGYLLSLDSGDVAGQLAGHVHRDVPGVIVLTHSSLAAVRVVVANHQQPQQQQQQKGQQEQAGPMTVSVYGVVQQAADMDDMQPSETADGQQRDGHQHTAPWQQQAERKYTGGVYEQQQQHQQQHLLPWTDSSGDGSGSVDKQWRQQQQQQTEELLAEFEVWAGRPGAAPLPVLVLPPRR